MDNKEIALELLNLIPENEIQDFVEANVDGDVSAEDFAEAVTGIYFAILAKLDAHDAANP